MHISSLDQYVSERVRPFLFLSHPVADSPAVVSEHWSRYYTSGPNDVYLLIGWGAILVTLRWILLGVFSKFARWWLISKSARYASLDEKSHNLGNGVRQANGIATAVAQNGRAAGNGTRSRSRTGSPPDSKENIIAIETSRLRSERQAKRIAKLERLSTRFAEQATTVVYYIIAWLFGLVRARFFLTRSNLFVLLNHSIVGDDFYVSRRTRISRHRRILDIVPSHPAPRSHQSVLLPRVCFLQHSAGYY